MSSPATRDAVYAHLPILLDDAAARDKRVLLFVDEAQALSQNLLTEIGHLAVTAGEPGGPARLSILLVGQDSLSAALARPENAALAKRVAVRCATARFTNDEAREYVTHQLKGIGREGPAFTEEGLRELVASSQGIPRLINTIADLALLTASRQGTLAIGADTVRGCARRFVQSPRPTNRSRSAQVKVSARTLRTRRPRRWASLSIPVLILLLTLVGYRYQSTWASAGKSALASVRQWAGQRHAPPEMKPHVVPAPAAALLTPAASVPATSTTSAHTPVAPAPELPSTNAPIGAVSPGRTSETGSIAPPASRAPRDPVSSPAPPVPEPPTAARLVPPPQRGLETPTVARPALSPAPPLPPPAPSLTEAAKEPSERPLAATAATAPVRSQTATAPPGGSAPRPAEARAGSESEPVDPGDIIDWLLSEYPTHRQ